MIILLTGILFSQILLIYKCSSALIFVCLAVVFVLAANKFLQTQWLKRAQILQLWRSEV